MVKVSFGRPCHVPPCLINEEGGSSLVPHRKLIVQENYTKGLVPHQDSEKGESCAAELAFGGGLCSRNSTR